MRCCFFLFFFMCVVAFVQIRLSQHRDSLLFALEFAVTYAVKGTNISKLESTNLIVQKERLLYGEPNTKINNHMITSFNGVDVSCYLKVLGDPLTFHTLSITSDQSTVVSTTVILNTEGVGHAFLKHNFFHLNPTFSLSHTFDNHISGGLANSSSSASGFIEIRNLDVVINKEIGLRWIEV